MFSEQITESKSLATCHIAHGRNGKCSAYNILVTKLEQNMPLGRVVVGCEGVCKDQWQFAVNLVMRRGFRKRREFVLQQQKNCRLLKDPAPRSSSPKSRPFCEHVCAGV